MTPEKAIIRHVRTMYDSLSDLSQDEVIDNAIYTIFRGKVTDAFASTGISQGYYSDVFKQLEAQGCISYLQRGSKSVETVIVLHHPPTPEGYQEPPKSDLTDPERYANLRESVNALETLVGGINIAEVLIEIENRLKVLEQSITAKDSVISVNTNTQGENR